jgi:hypothetical protein
MHARGPRGNASGRSRVQMGRARVLQSQARVRVSRASLAAAAALLAVGCASSATAAGNSGPAASSSPAAANITPCGTTRTAANVPVHIQVEHGQVSCTTAMTIERAYAKAIMEGRAPGNGGGGPVNINGWTCQGFNTPEVLKTGQASKCVQAGNEILAILPAPA